MMQYNDFLDFGNINTFHCGLSLNSDNLYFKSSTYLYRALRKGGTLFFINEVEWTLTKKYKLCVSYSLFCSARKVTSRILAPKSCSNEKNFC